MKVCSPGFPHDTHDLPAALYVNNQDSTLITDTMIMTVTGLRSGAYGWSLQDYGSQKPQLRLVALKTYDRVMILGSALAVRGRHAPTDSRAGVAKKYRAGSFVWFGVNPPPSHYYILGLSASPMKQRNTPYVRDGICSYLQFSLEPSRSFMKVVPIRFRQDASENELLMSMRSRCPPPMLGRGFIQLGHLLLGTGQSGAGRRTFGSGGNYRNNNNNNYSRDNNRNSGAGRDQRNRGQQSHRSTNSGFPSVQAGHLQRDCKKNFGASSSGHADNGSRRIRPVSMTISVSDLYSLPDMRNFDINSGNGHVSEHTVLRLISECFQFHDVFPAELPLILTSIATCEFNIELILELSPISKLLSHGTIELNELKDQLQNCWSEDVLFAPSVSPMGCTGSRRGISLCLSSGKGVEAIHRMAQYADVSRKGALKELKQRLFPRLFLPSPSSTGGFQIYSDASKKVLGCTHAAWKGLLLVIAQNNESNNVARSSEVMERRGVWGFPPILSHKIVLLSNRLVGFNGLGL
ncbi:hypothetical protein Tco_0163137 [Tanacetum coccineum]